MYTNIWIIFIKGPDNDSHKVFRWHLTLKNIWIWYLKKSDESEIYGIFTFTYLQEFCWEDPWLDSHGDHIWHTNHSKGYCSLRISWHGLENAVDEGFAYLLQTNLYCKARIVPTLINLNMCMSKMKLKSISEIENKQFRVENKSH